MEIMELAAELGKALKKDKCMEEFEAAKAAYSADFELQKLAIEYEVQQRAMQNEAEKPEIDTTLIDLIQNRINELYEEISTRPAYVELGRTQAAVNDLMNRVNQTIMTQITGEEPSGCTHNCSTCSGCH